MEFRKFESLENTYNKRQVQMVRDQLLDEGEWIVTEKLDGANFAFHYDGVELKIASRNQFVDGTFFACQEVVDRYSAAIKRLYTACMFPEGTHMIIYGELVGPGVQRRVNYGEKDFYAFDIVVDGKPVHKLAALGACGSFGIKTAPILGIVPFERALEIPNTFKSKVFEVEGDNEAEGTVIEPVEPKWYASGKRVYLKYKTEAFSEKSNPKKPKVAVDVPEDVAAMLEVITPYLSESRVHSVVSKIGKVGQGDFGKVLKLTVQDAVEDYEKEADVEVGRSLQENTSFLLKLLTKEATPIVRAVFLPLISE